MRKFEKGEEIIFNDDENKDYFRKHAVIIAVFPENEWAGKEYRIAFEDGTVLDVPSEYLLVNNHLDPIPFEDVDWDRVYNSAVSLGCELETDEEALNMDTGYYMSEEILETVFGEKCFDHFSNCHLS